MRFQDLKNATPSPVVYVNAQDYVAQVGQGAIANRRNEHLGRSDLGVIMFRKIWERELRALKEGRPLKKWVPSQGPVGLLQSGKELSSVAEADESNAVGIEILELDRLKQSQDETPLNNCVRRL